MVFLVEVFIIDRHNIREMEKISKRG